MLKHSKTPVPVYWAVNAGVSVSLDQSTSVMATNLMGASQARSHVILGSGTSLIGVNASFFQDVMAAILPSSHSCLSKDFGNKKSKNVLMVCPCSTDIRPLIFTFDGTQDGDRAQFKVSLTKDDLLWEMSGECVVKIQGLTFPGHVWLLGDAFLRKAYLVHDTEKFQVTFFPVPEASTA